VRREAARALGEIGDKRAIEPLENARNDEDEKVREAAVLAQRKIRHNSKFRVSSDKGSTIFPKGSD
jgi:HEAT repeat protein